MFHKKKPEVLVVGAGPVGLFAALVLAKRGIRVEVLDRAWRVGSRSYALALHAESLRLMDEFGLLGAVLERAHRVRKVAVYDDQRRRTEMRISELPTDHSFAAVMRQDELETLLQTALRDMGVKVLWNHEVSGLEVHEDGVTVTVEKLDNDTMGYGVQHSDWVVVKTFEKQATFIIGADGHASRVRRSLGIEFPRVGETADFAVFEFKTDAELGDEMTLSLGEETTNVLWPLPGGYCRWSFLVQRHDTAWDTREKNRSLVMPGAERGPELAETRLRELIQERATWFKGSIDAIRWSLLVRFESRLADSFGGGRLWLAGDAGHLTGPAGIHSMNVGLREASDLAAALARIVKDGAPMSELSTYGDARLAEWRRLLGLTAALEPRADTDLWIAKQRHRLLSCIPASGDDLRHLAGQMGLEPRTREHAV